MENTVEESAAMYGQSTSWGNKNTILAIAKQLNEQDIEYPISTLEIELYDNELIRDDRFMHLLGAENPLLKIETEGKQRLILSFMPNHVKNQSGLTRLLIKLGIWNETKNDNLGELFDSRSTVEFADGSLKEPDITYILKSELHKMKAEGYIVVVPTLVVEWFSTFDRFSEANQKMQYYMNQGVKLAWLIVPQEEKTYIYRPDREVQTKDFNENLDGGEILQGFSVNLKLLIEG
jgi:Uma2 family endonuclease